VRLFALAVADAALWLKRMSGAYKGLARHCDIHHTNNPYVKFVQGSTPDAAEMRVYLDAVS